MSQKNLVDAALCKKMCFAGNMMPPFSIGYVKGWRRSTALLAVLCGIKALEIKLDDLPAIFKEGFSYAMYCKR